MLNTILEYRKGILFVRLDGSLTKNTVNSISEKITSIVLADNLDNIVINADNLVNVDFKGINLIFYFYELCKKNKGSILICGLNEEIRKKFKKNRVFNYIKEIDNELESFNLIRI